MTYPNVHLPPILSKPSYVFPDKPLPPINNHIQSYSVSLYNNNDLRILSKFNFIDTLNSPSPVQHQQYQQHHQLSYQQYQPCAQTYTPFPALASPSELSPLPSTALLPCAQTPISSHNNPINAFSSPPSTSSTVDDTTSKRKKKTPKTYTCHCNRSFTTSGHLARHMRIHTGEKNYTCPYAGCFARFSRQDNCMQHYRTHLGSNTRPRNKSATKQRKTTAVTASPMLISSAAPDTTATKSSVSPIVVRT